MLAGCKEYVKSAMPKGRMQNYNMRTSTNFMYDAAIYEPPLGAGDPGCREF